MANKKKTIQQSEIKNTASTQGNVKITLCKGNREKKFLESHNTGTINLCNYLRDSLIGGEEIYYRRPGYIIPCGKDNGGNLVELFRNGVFMQSIKKSENLEAYQSGAVITFKIQGDLIPKGNPIKGFKLLSSEDSVNRKEYASIDITNIDGIDYSFTVDADTDVKIDWTLIVSYK